MGNASIAKMLNEEGIASPMRYKYEKGLTKNGRYADSLWNDGTIAAMIVNPVYIGDMEQGIQKEAMYMGIQKHKPQKSGRIYVEGTHEPILSRELFDKVQNLIEERKQKVIADRKKYANVQRKDNIFILPETAESGGKQENEEYLLLRLLWQGVVQCPLRHHLLQTAVIQD